MELQPEDGWTIVRSKTSEVVTPEVLEGVGVARNVDDATDDGLDVGAGVGHVSLSNETVDF